MAKEFKALTYCLQCFSSDVALEPFSHMLRYDLIDWNQFIKLVRWHKVTPLICKVLTEQNFNFFPTDVLSELKLDCNKNALRVLKLTAELVRLGKLFKKENIPFISFKGPFLAQRIYGDVTLREPGDLDLLISENYVPVAHQLLIQQGYHLFNPKLYPKSMLLYMRYQKDMIYFHPLKKIIVELHWRLFNNQHEFIVPQNKLFSSVETDSLSGFSIMPKEIEILYLLHHGSMSSWMRLRWLCDIQQINHTSCPNWLKLLAIARQIKTERSFLEGLNLAHQLLNVPLDPVITECIEQNKVVRSISKISYSIMIQAKPSTLLMRIKRLSSRLRLKEYCFSFYKASLARLILRLFKFIPA